MLPPNLLRERPQELWQSLARRGFEVDREQFAERTERLKELRQRDQVLRQERNELSAAIGRAGPDADPALRGRAAEIAAELKGLAGQLAQAEEDWRQFCLELPNLPDAQVPDGQTEQDNLVLQVFDADGEPRALDWNPPKTSPTHVEIGADCYLAEAAAAMSGARFAALTGPLAELHRALGQFFLQLQLQRGYRECWVPWLLLPRALEGTGQLPKFAADLFAAGDGHYLLPTAEVPLVNLFADRILTRAELPAKVVALTPCFRSEAGSYGRDTRGLIRQHQFEKVELVRLTRAEESESALEAMVEDARLALVQLQLPHRVVALCAGDLTASAARTLDLEVWMPGQQQWREVSSCSNCRDFQTRRLAIRCRSERRKGTELVHSLNGSALAVGRSLAALLENGWDGEDVRVPPPLRPFIGGRDSLFGAR